MEEQTKKVDSVPRSPQPWVVNGLETLGFVGTLYMYFTGALDFVHLLSFGLQT